MTLGGLLLLVCIVAVVVGFTKIKEDRDRISALERKTKKGDK